MCLPTTWQWPEVVEDFVRNYLLRMGMLTTLDCFQVEWLAFGRGGAAWHGMSCDHTPRYRMKECDLLQEGEGQSLPDVYHQWVWAGWMVGTSLPTPPLLALQESAAGEAHRGPTGGGREVQDGCQVGGTVGWIPM